MKDRLFFLEIAQILQCVEHESRRVRTDPSHPDNKPYQFLNELGEVIEKLLIKY